MPVEVVYAGFARGLETRLAAAERELAALRADAKEAGTPVMWRREFEGDDSDLGQWVYADTEDELDEPLERWQPLYAEVVRPRQETLEESRRSIARILSLEPEITAALRAEPGAQGNAA